MSGRIVLSDDLLGRALQARAGNNISKRALADSIAAQIIGTAQVRRRRPMHVQWPARSLVAAALAMVSIVAVIVLGPASRPAVREIEVGANGTPGVPLEAGRYRSGVFVPRVMLTVPGRSWVPSVDLPAELQLRAAPTGVPGEDRGTLTVLRVANVRTGVCGYDGNTPWTAGSGGPSSFVTWLGTRLPTGLGAPRPVTIGGRAGLETEFQATTALSQECDYGLLLTDVGTAASPRYAEIAVDGRRVRLAAIDVSGSLVIVMTEGGWTNRFDEVRREADAVIATMAFE